MAMNRKWGGWAAMLAATGAGCTAVLGIDKDYYPLGAGGGTASSTSGGSGGMCSGGACGGVCALGDKQCQGNVPQSCDGSGQWQGVVACMGQTCNGGDCVGVCAPGDKQCQGNVPQSCDGSGQWQGVVACMGQTCSGGDCVGVCAPGDKQCTGNVPQSCDGSGQWQGVVACMGQTCNGGDCVGVCAPGDKQCTGNVPQSCDGSGQWQSGVCSAQTDICVAGACIVPPSCAGLASTCGPGNNESCCAIGPVPGGTYNRSNDPGYPAMVNDFRLDRFEITVGRFRAFVNAYPGSKPAAGAGAHPLIAGSGWDATWAGSLPADKTSLMTAVKCSATYQTWTDAAGANENLPMNCITWYDVFAFCTWDGGRLPTEAEWNYAAAGGAEQRQYPWGGMAPSPTYAVYDCTGDMSAPGVCTFGDILKVGSKPAGDGKFGQADLAGSVWEWNLDWLANPYGNPCNNCANLNSASSRVDRGGDWFASASVLLSSGRDGYVPSYRGSLLGARCARTP